MSQVVYNLMNCSTLRCMVPPKTSGSGAYGNASLPLGLAGQGMYIIVNTDTNNRYAGISSDLTQRFNTRLATVTEMGFSEEQMEQIWLFWGAAATQNTPGYLGNNNPQFVMVTDYSAPLVGNVDGVGINLEKLLIRFLLLHLGAGGTVSNNLLAWGPYVNPTAADMRVTLNWPAGFFNTTTSSAVWHSGQAW
jgi:hypothetical protein